MLPGRAVKTEYPGFTWQPGTVLPRYYDPTSSVSLCLVLWHSCSTKTNYLMISHGSLMICFWTDTLGGADTLIKWHNIYIFFCVPLLCGVYFGIQSLTRMDELVDQIWPTSHQLMITDLDLQAVILPCSFTLTEQSTMNHQKPQSFFFFPPTPTSLFSDPDMIYSTGSSLFPAGLKAVPSLLWDLYCLFWSCFCFKVMQQRSHFEADVLLRC